MDTILIKNASSSTLPLVRHKYDGTHGKPGRTP
jgi:hypothetical protein